MSDKSGRTYENLPQVIFQILGKKQFPDLSVERDVTLKGKTASHQIDIYSKFDVSGVPYETIVQTKDWGKPVDQLHLLGQPEKAIGHESPIEPWLALHNRSACLRQKPTGAVTTSR